MGILEVKNVSYKYSGTDKNVLEDININFEKGKIYAIVGKSGSGKTTLLSILSGLDVCTGGDIYFDGGNLKEINRYDYRAKNIGVVFQAYNLLTTASAVENVVLSMNISGVKDPNKDEIAFSTLESVGLSREESKRKVLKLSGGQQQRVGIARVLSHDPDIIIADEPTGNLDYETEEEILNIFAKLAHDKDKCVIVVTHSKVVAEFADVVINISSGRLADQL